MSGDAPKPDEVERLLEERAARRLERDFESADALRERIAALGYRVIDSAAGSRAEPMDPDPVELERVAPDRVASVLDEAPTEEASFQWIVQGWPEDVARGIRSIDAYAGGGASGGCIQHVVVDAAEVAGRWAAGVEVVRLTAGVGWAAARNCGLRRSRGRLIVVVDGSIEATGDILSPLARVLADPTVGVAGPFGLVTSDLRSFASSAGVGDGRDVDAVEGYVMAFRRELLGSVGYFDERFAFYRNADIEYSFRAKDRGLRTVVVPLPMHRHEHRVWEATSRGERERLSRRNFNVFLERFRGRTDLTLAGRARGPAP
jgi:hypothetical protein